VLAVSEPDQVIVVQDRDQRDRVLAAAAVLGLDRQVEILPVRPERLPPVPREYRDRIRRGNSRG